MGLKDLLSAIITSRQGDWSLTQIVDEVIRLTGRQEENLRQRVEVALDSGVRGVTGSRFRKTDSQGERYWRWYCAPTQDQPAPCV